MTARFTLILMLIAAFACAAVPASAKDSHIATASDLQAAIENSMTQEQADHAAINLLLERPAVAKVAGAAGIELQRAKGAAALLSGAELQQIAAEARRIDAGLVGGDSTIVISTTAVIIALLVLILLTQ